MRTQPRLLLVLSEATLFFCVQVSGQPGWFWQNPVPQGNTLHDVVTIDARTFLAVGDLGTVVKTTDAAAHWSVQHYVGGSGQDLHGVSFFNADTGIAVGIFGTLARTTDGGLTWVSLTSGITADFYDVSMITAGVGVAVGNRGAIYRTTDGGVPGEVN